MTTIPKAVEDDELEQWAKLRADDAGRLARELIVYRRAALPHLAKPVDGERHDRAIEAACRAMHEAQGSGDADAPRHSPYQNSWDEPDSVRWEQWIETCEEVVSAYRSALGSGTVAQEPVVDDKRWMDSGFVRDIRNHARRLWNEDEFYCSWNDENKEHYIVRAAMLAAAPPAAVQKPVAVKALEWRRHGWVEGFAQPEGLGVWYSIQPDKPVHGPGDPPFTCSAIWGVPGQTVRECLGEAFQSLEEAKAAAKADFEQRIRSALSTSQSEPAPTTSSGVTYTQAECDEMCEIAERDGYEKAVQEIDQKTGGDGEYRYCLGMEDSDWHTPDAPAMIQRIVDRFEVLNLLDEATKTGSDQPDDFPAPEIAAIREVLPPELLKLTFAIQHNPNCPSPWLVRLPGKSGAIDMKPYGDPLGLVRHQTGDILGFGKTLEEAARAAPPPPAAAQEPVALNRIDRQKAADAAVKANHAFGQWMPERWLHLFLDAYEGKL
jgi:hypothetical protein